MAESNPQTVGTPGAVLAAPAPARKNTRLVPAILLAVSLVLLGVSSWVDPDPSGVGTHTRLGLPPCGFLQLTGMPCATCGMTTAFALAAHGRLLEALVVQPAGALLALATAMTFLVSAYSLIAGASLAPLGKMLGKSLLLWIGALVLLGSWVYKILFVVTCR